MPMNIDFLSNAAGALILIIEGWDTSWGLAQYLEVCRKEGIAVFDLVPGEIEKTLHAIQAHMVTIAGKADFLDQRT